MDCKMEEVKRFPEEFRVFDEEIHFVCLDRVCISDEKTSVLEMLVNF